MNAAERDRNEEARWLTQPTTPQSEKPREAWGSLLTSVQTVRGLCTHTTKCVRRDGHEGACWPE